VHTVASFLFFLLIGAEIHWKGSTAMRRFFMLLFLVAFFNLAFAQSTTFDVKAHYIKKEYRIPMRDGVHLFTSVYLPKDTTRSYPILLQRTPYSVAPYGEDRYKKHLGPSYKFEEEGFIFVYQDVRGRFMSEGTYCNMRPYLPHKHGRQTDETTDTYDTIEWLIRHLPRNNGKVGVWGISYPGFYTSMSIIDAHPALKAASPQAPIANWFVGDDVHHNGAFALLLAFDFFSVFGVPRPEPVNHWNKPIVKLPPDGYQFFLEMGALPNANRHYFHHKIAFWDSLMAHDTYDAFWKARNILPHLKHIKPAVLVVGGWFDAEDLYGTLNTYKAIERQNPGSTNALVMGPWSHGGWQRSAGDRLGDIRFGQKTSHFFQDSVLFPFFMFYLKNRPGYRSAEALCFDTGARHWRQFAHWPPKFQPHALYFRPQHTLTFTSPQSDDSTYDAYISDPAKPVPFTQRITNRWGREFMVEDQRFAARRPDVLVYRSSVLTDSLTLAGPVDVHLSVSSTGSDADFVVKLIDVYPDTAQDFSPNPCKVRMGGYQQLLRADILRAKFRNSFSKPEPLVPGKITTLKMTMQDVYHTFLPGHRIMIQIQSSWFPLFDRNPQVFTNIYRAENADFQPAEQRVFYSRRYPSYLTLPVLSE